MELDYSCVVIQKSGTLVLNPESRIPLRGLEAFFVSLSSLKSCRLGLGEGHKKSQLQRSRLSNGCGSYWIRTSDLCPVKAAL